jgi:hypothetical protein
MLITETEGPGNLQNVCCFIGEPAGDQGKCFCESACRLIEYTGFPHMKTMTQSRYYISEVSTHVLSGFESISFEVWLIYLVFLNANLEGGRSDG